MDWEKLKEKTMGDVATTLISEGLGVVGGFVGAAFIGRQIQNAVKKDDDIVTNTDKIVAWSTNNVPKLAIWYLSKKYELEPGEVVTPTKEAISDARKAVVGSVVFDTIMRFTHGGKNPASATLWNWQVLDDRHEDDSQEKSVQELIQENNDLMNQLNDVLQKLIEQEQGQSQTVQQRQTAQQPQTVQQQQTAQQPQTAQQQQTAQQPQTTYEDSGVQTTHGSIQYIPKEHTLPVTKREYEGEPIYEEHLQHIEDMSYPYQQSPYGVEEEPIAQISPYDLPPWFGFMQESAQPPTTNSKAYARKETYGFMEDEGEDISSWYSPNPTEARDITFGFMNDQYWYRPTPRELRKIRYGFMGEQTE